MDDDEPPQPVTATKARRTVTADRVSRRRLPTSSKPEAPKATVHPSKPITGGKTNEGPPIALPAAVVDTVTVAEVAEPLTMLTEAGTLQTSAGVAAGVRPHVRFTVPLKVPAGVRAKLKVAVWPAEIVEELEPDAIPIVKSGAAVPVPESATVCGLPAALSVIVRFAAALPATAGTKMTEIWQLLPAGKDVLQVFVSVKTPEAAIWVKLSELSPVLVKVMI